MPGYSAKMEVICSEYIWPDNKNSGLKFLNSNVQLPGNLAHGFPSSFVLLVRFTNDDVDYAELEMWGSFPFANNINLQNPLGFFGDLEKRKQNRNYSSTFSFKAINFFKGTAGYDENFQKFIDAKIIQLLILALKRAESRVDEQFEINQKIASSNQPFQTYSINNTPIIIDSFELS